LMNYLTNQMGMTETTAKQVTKDSAKGKMINKLVSSDVIEKHSHGWVVVDNLDIQAMILRKNEVTR